jgi:ubiquinone/menaquinone biosynthesis C-methylase UbiE
VVTNKDVDAAVLHRFARSDLPLVANFPHPARQSFFSRWSTTYVLDAEKNDEVSDDRRLVEEQITYYRQRAGEYDITSHPPGDPYAPYGNQLIQALHDFSPQGKVLDIACGTGLYTRHLVQHDVDITALDSSPEMLNEARKKITSDRVRFIETDIFSWKPDDQFDIVFFSFWLSHVPPTSFDSYWALVEAALKDDGRVFFMDESEDSFNEEWVSEDEAIAQRKLLDGSVHRLIKIFWNPNELEARLQKLGWSISVHKCGPFLWGEGGKSRSLLI